jgi:choline/glycine/proline betaine transport protein
MSELVSKTFTLYAYDPTDWLGGWTIFYWGWWLSWSPFVGLFIARISRGRTIREFTSAPSSCPVASPCCGWACSATAPSTSSSMAAPGAGRGGVGQPGGGPVSVPRVPALLDLSRRRQPGHGGGVLRDLGGQRRPGPEHALGARPRRHADPAAVFWAAVIGAIAAVLLLAGGLASLQTAAIASALPFSLALLGAIWGFAGPCPMDAGSATRRAFAGAWTAPATGAAASPSLLSFPEDRTCAIPARRGAPALREFAAELSAHADRGAGERALRRTQPRAPGGAQRR